MNNTQIDIEGITVIYKICNSEHSTDVSYLLILKDQNQTEAEIQVAYGKITKVTWSK